MSGVAEFDAERTATRTAGSSPTATENEPAVHARRAPPPRNSDQGRLRAVRGRSPGRRIRVGLALDRPAAPVQPLVSPAAPPAAARSRRTAGPEG
jgi:hypothetical protein